MPFRPQKKPPQFADLKGILAQAKQLDNPLYQTVQVLIDRLQQFQGHTADSIASVSGRMDVIDGGGGSGETGTGNTEIDLDQTFVTIEDETDSLENSVQLVAGEGIEVEDGVVSVKYYDAPLTDGDLVEASLIFAAGECIIVQVPV